MKTKITKTQMIEDIIKVATLLNKPPSINEYRKYGAFHFCTLNRRFGSWNNALKQIIGSINKERSQPLKEHPCEGCGIITKNPKFCSASCAAKTNNVKYPKRHKETRQCPDCGRTASKNKPCHHHFMINAIESYGNRTIASLFEKAKNAQHHYRSVRLHAHRVAFFNKMEKKCFICGYDIHVQLCHKKPIHSFTRDTLLKEVNDLSNLVFLCPNHHLQMEHGHIDSATLSANKLSKI